MRGERGLEGTLRSLPKDARLDRLERRVISQRLVVMHGEVWYDKMQMGYKTLVHTYESRYGFINTDAEGGK